MEILMFIVGFAIFLLYITGYMMMFNKQHKLQSNKKKAYSNWGMDKLDDFDNKPVPEKVID
jgi:hypothetical protein